MTRIEDDGDVGLRSEGKGGLLSEAALRAWRTVAQLVGRVGGPDCEVVLHDFADPMHSVVYVVNGSVTDRRPGQGFRHLVAEMLRAQAEKNGDLLPDWWFVHSVDGREKLIRSMTMLIRDGEGQLAGALCVNIDVTSDAKAFERMRGVLPGLADVTLPKAGPDGICPNAGRTFDAAPAPDDLAGSVPEAVFRLIDRMAFEAMTEVPPGGTLGRESRRRLIGFMEARGIFLVKGAIERAAERLGVSRVTVYSDLDDIRKKSVPA